MAGRHAAPTGYLTRRERRDRAARGVVPLARLLGEADRTAAACRWCAGPSTGTVGGSPACRRCGRRHRALLQTMGRILPAGALCRLARA